MISNPARVDRARKEGVKGLSVRKIEKGKTHILILGKDDPTKELEFELEFQSSLTPVQRYRSMESLVRMGLEFEKSRGYKNTPKTITRS